MTERTLSEQIDYFIEAAKSDIVKSSHDEKEIWLLLGHRLLEAAGVFSGEKHEGCSAYGELVVRGDTIGLRESLVEVTATSVLMFGEIYLPGDYMTFREKRNVLASILGKELLDNSVKKN